MRAADAFPPRRTDAKIGTVILRTRGKADEARDLHVAGMVKDGEPVPAPCSLDAIMIDPPATSVPINVMSPEDQIAATA